MARQRATATGGKPARSGQASPAPSSGEDPLDGREIEAKFLLTDAALARQWQAGTAFLAGYRLNEGVVVEDTDTYYDTPDFALVRRGVTLRLRDRVRAGDPSGSVEQIVGCKDIDFNTPRGIHARREVEVASTPALPTGAPISSNDLPEAVQETIAGEYALGNGVKLVPVAQVRQLRHKWRVARSRSNAAPLGELSVDDLQILAPDSVSGQRGAAWRDLQHIFMAEVEIDAESGRGALRDLAGKLRETPGLAPTDLGKLQTALLAIGQDALTRPVETLRRAHTAEFCRAIWAGQLAVMLNNEAGVRVSDDIEYVHDMRVATRRARAAARLYAGYFAPHKHSIARFSAALRKTGRLLGKVRDLDVALARIEAFAAERSAKAAGSGRTDRRGGRKDKALARRIDELMAARAAAHSNLVHWLDSKDYGVFIKRFFAFCATSGKAVAPTSHTAGEAPAPVQLRHTLPSMIWSRFEAVRAFEPLFESAVGTDATPIPVETLHALRIECKYLRYHLEFALPLLGGEGKTIIDSLRKLQEELGDLNDAVVGGQLLLDTGTEASEPESNGDGSQAGEADATNRRAENPDDALAQWQALQLSAIERMRKAIPDGFAAFVGVENRQRLARAIAQL